MRSLLFLAALVMLQAPVPATIPQFADGMAQPVFDGQAIVRHNVWVEVPNLDTDQDGATDRIRVQISRPAATEKGTKLPVILVASPYSGGTRPYPRYDIDVGLYAPGQPPPPLRYLERPPAPDTAPADAAPVPAVPPRNPYLGTDLPIRDIAATSYQGYFLPRGFIFADANSLGTGHSTGCPTIGGIEENLAMKAVIDWFNGRGRAFDADGSPVTASWTTGATGMIGTSYVGTLPIGAASLGIEGLRAIVPIAGVSSYYDHRRSYGAVINSFPMTGTDPDTLFDNILSRKYPDACARVRERIVRGADRLTGDYNAFWDERNYVKDVGGFKTAVLISHGLNDFNVKPRHAGRLWNALKEHGVPARIWWHQGGHGDRANSARQAEWRAMLNRFWTEHLFGVKNGVMDGPKAVIERENNVWVEYADWPVPGARATSLHVVPRSDGAGQLVESRPSRGAVEIIRDDSSIDATALVAAPVSAHRLVYQTAPLASPAHVSGVPSVSLRLSFNKPAAIVSAMLVDYKPTGAPAIVTRGWADPQNRTSLWKTTPIVPGTAYTIAFELQPHDYVFATGSRIGLVLLSSDRLFTLRPPPGTEITVHTRDTTLVLPIVGGRQALGDAVATTAPRTAAR
jgi:X-Pro dipeptidyl-peptidase